ncbi:DUF4405 domain-containing protein [Oscillospiraceae bacterium 50-60]
MNKPAFKRAIDLLMTAALMALMGYSLVGEAAHEWIGAGMLLLSILHHGLNWSWIRGLKRGRYTAFRVLQTLLAALVLLTMLGAMASGAVLSRHVFGWLSISGARGWARVVHMLCAYWGFVFLSLHFGIHWGQVVAAVRRKAPLRLPVTVSRSAAIFIAAYGAAALWRNRIADYLFLRSHFVFFDFERPLALFFLDYLAIMGLFVCCGYYGGRILTRRRACD